MVLPVSEVRGNFDQSPRQHAYRSYDRRKQMIYRSLTFTTAVLASLLIACATPEPVPEPGMEVLKHARNEEMQVTTGVDWNSYSKIILHTAQVEFRENWKRDQERNHGIVIRDDEMEMFRAAVSDQLAKVMEKRISEGNDYELTSESGAGVMRFLPNIVDLDIRGPGWVQNSIVESMTNSRGSMTIEIVIRDSVSDEILAVAWQDQSDPQEGYMEMTNVVNNTMAFRLMMQRWTDWVLKQLEKAGAK